MCALLRLCERAIIGDTGPKPCTVVSIVLVLLVLPDGLGCRIQSAAQTEDTAQMSVGYRTGRTLQTGRGVPVPCRAASWAKLPYPASDIERLLQPRY